MGLNNTPAAERVHIGFFGKRNAGKSSVVNAVTNQQIAIVSDIKGTTTDPVYKTMEILPIGPVMIIDTPGLDDEGVLGELRIGKAKQVLNKVDVAILVVDAANGMEAEDKEILDIFISRRIPYIVAFNKSDLIDDYNITDEKYIFISAKTKDNINQLKEKIIEVAKPTEKQTKILGEFLERGDVVVLVTPIDEAAPKGRMILPQQQTIRDILDADAMSVVVKETELEQALNNLKNKPKMVVTDSQAFGFVSKVVPDDITLTSFSILFARYKGQLSTAVRGARGIEKLKDGDIVLISEGCTHHRQCNDIGTVKMPGWIKKYTGKNISFEYTSGTEFPEDLRKYAMVVHCGGCMLNDKAIQYRQSVANEQKVPFTNYGIIIAYMNGILDRSIELFESEM